MLDALRFHRPDGRTLTFHLGTRVLSIEQIDGGSRIELDTSMFGPPRGELTNAYDVKESPAEVEVLLEARAEKAKAEYRKRAEEDAKRRKHHRIGMVQQMPTNEFGEDLGVDFDFDPMTMAGAGDGLPRRLIG